MELQKVVIGTEEIMTGRQTKTGSLADAKIAELVSLAEKFPVLPKCINVELKAEIGKSTFWQRAKKVEKAIGLIIKGNVDDAGNTTLVKCAWTTAEAKAAFLASIKKAK